MKKTIHEYTEQELIAMPTEQFRELQKQTYPEVSIPEMFQHMWTIEPEMAYHRHSPEFLRMT